MSNTVASRDHRAGARRTHRRCTGGLRRRLLGALAAIALAANVSCGDLTEATADPSVDLTLTIVAPDTVYREVGLAVSLSVQVIDDAGLGRPGAAVLWRAEPGSGSISSATRSITDDLGFASAVWTLGTSAGAQHVVATLESDCACQEVQFVATALAGPTVAVSFLTDTLTLTAYRETALLAPRFVDAFGNESHDTPITWSTADTAVVTLDNQGLVSAVAPGVTTATASLANHTESITVVVKPEGAVTLTFDDGYRTTYTAAFPILEEYDLAANVGVITGTLGWPDFMTLEQLGELDAAGWSMVSHSVSHANLTELSDAELDDELRTSQEWLIQNGFRGSDIFIVPYHTWDLREVAAIGNYYRAARGLNTIWFQSDSLAQWLPSDPYKLTGIDADDLPYTTEAGRDRLRGILDRAMSEGLFAEVFFHRLPPENVAAFREVVLMLDEFRDRMAPYHELFAEPRVIH